VVDNGGVGVGIGGETLDGTRGETKSTGNRSEGATEEREGGRNGSLNI